MASAEVLRISGSAQGFSLKSVLAPSNQGKWDRRSGVRTLRADPFSPGVLDRVREVNQLQSQRYLLATQFCSCWLLHPPDVRGKPVIGFCAAAMPIMTGQLSLAYSHSGWVQRGAAALLYFSSSGAGCHLCLQAVIWLVTDPCDAHALLGPLLSQAFALLPARVWQSHGY